MKKNVLVTFADKKFVKQAKQVFSSAYRKGGWDEDFLLITNDMKKKDRMEFEKRGILVHRIKNNFKKESFRNYEPCLSREWASIVLNKLFLFSEYFKRWERVVYLDSDVIVRGSLRDLKYLEGFNAAEDCTLNLSFQFWKAKKIGKKSDREILEELKSKIMFSEKAFNSGVMVYSTDILSKGLYSELMRCYKKYKNIIKLGEQSVLNIFFYKKWKRLPAVYNGFSPFIKNEEVVIIHTIHNAKFRRAWNVKSVYNKEWRENLKLFDKTDFRKNSWKGTDSLFFFDEIRIKKNSDRLLKKMRTKLWLDNFLGFRIRVDRGIGLLGKKLKKKNPKVYWYLKRIKERFSFSGLFKKGWGNQKPRVIMSKPFHQFEEISLVLIL